MRVVYSTLVRLVAPAAFALALLRGFRDRVYWEGALERFGFGGRRDGAACIWVHAVSLGEMAAAAPLVRALRARHPEQPLVVTTATATGRARARALFGAAVEVRYLPYDLPGAVRRFLERIRPRLAVILETELWPNLLAACRRRAVPVVLASARMTPRSLQRYRRFRGLFGEAAAGLACVAAQSEADAERFRALGAPRAHTRVVGNIKLDLEPDAVLLARGEALRRELGLRPVWVAGSTHEGEESALIEVHSEVRRRVPDALLVLVPRHPQRFARVAQLLAQSGVGFDRRSARRPVDPKAQVLLVDSVGELLAFYAAADVAFVGGSLVPVGGHNLLEPAALGVPVLTGPYTANSAEIARALTAAGGARTVSSAKELASEVSALLTAADLRADVGARARAFVERERGSLARLLELMEEWLETPAPRPAAAAYP